LTRKPRKATPQSLHNAALFYLQRFATSAENLRRVLVRRVERSVRAHQTDREQGLAAVDDVIVRFRRSGLLDDRAYAEARAKSLRARGMPSRVIRGKLRQKGVAEDDVDAGLAAVDGDTDDADFAAAVNFARRRRLGPFRRAEAVGADRRVTGEKDLAILARAGFRYDVARRILAAATPEELDPTDVNGS
jgi:regulatory protein